MRNSRKRRRKKENRTKYDIVADMIKIAAVEPRGKTEFVYKASLNFNLVNKYLPKMMELGLIEFTDNPGEYISTEKGKDYLEVYRKLKEYYE